MRNEIGTGTFIAWLALASVASAQREGEVVEERWPEHEGSEGEHMDGMSSESLWVEDDASLPSEEDLLPSEGVEARPGPRVEVHVHSGEEPDGRTSEAKPSAPGGTHFLLELHGGLAFGGDVGGATSLFLGAGGRLAGGWLRVYALAGIAHASLRDEAPSLGAAPLRATRHHLDLTGGIRLLGPVFGPVRIFADALIGATYAQASVEGGALSRRQQADWSGFVVHGGAGVQVRIRHELSVGARFGLRWSGDPLEELRNGLELGHPRRSRSLTGSATWHF